MPCLLPHAPTPVLAQLGGEQFSVLKSWQCTAPYIHGFRCEAQESSGYAASHRFNVKFTVPKNCGPNATSPIAHSQCTEFGRPAVLPGNRHVAVGTDNPDSINHFLTILDGSKLSSSGMKSFGETGSPVLCSTPMPAHVSDLRWLQQDRLLVVTGKGDLRIFRFDSSSDKLVQAHCISGAASSYVREIAIHPYSRNNVVFGGFDQQLTWMDLERPEAPFLHRVNVPGSVIGSVKWSEDSGGNTISCGLDEGTLLLFDVRQRSQIPCVVFATGKADLFAHEQYDSCHFLLGYGDGCLKHIDLRQPSKILHSIVDPYVECVGQIEFNHAVQAFVVSGYTDFSVWKLVDGFASVHSHSELGAQPLRGKGYATTAVWYEHNTVLAADNSGAIGIWEQDFE